MGTLPLPAVALVLVLAPALSRADGDPDHDGRGNSSGSATHREGRLLDATQHEQSSMLSFFAMPGEVWTDGAVSAGIAARYTTPLLEDGIIHKLNDSFELESGVNAWRRFSGVRGTAFFFTNEARWTFHFTNRFAAYGMAGLGPAYGFSDDGRSLFKLLFTAGAGIHFNISESVALRAEVNPQTAMAGFGFSL